MNTRTAALVAALTEAIRFAEDVYGDADVHLANRVTKPWCQALKAAIAAATTPEASADPYQAIKFHLDQAVDLAAEGWQHALAIIEHAPDCEIGEVLDSIQALAVDTPVAGDNVKPSDIPLPIVVGISGEWRTTQRRRRRAKGLPPA